MALNLAWWTIFESEDVKNLRRSEIRVVHTNKDRNNDNFNDNDVSVPADEG